MTSLRLSIMMFIQFFIWGAWYVTAPLYLAKIGFTGTDFGWTYSVGPIAGILSPFFVGIIADRFFSTERVLGAMHILGGGAMLAATSMMQAENPSPAMINLVFFCHMLCYYPTLALTNSLALQTMTNPEKQFPLIRVFGTIGWIIAGWVLSWQGWDSSINMFYLAGGAAVLMGVYSFFLPHAAPPAAGQDFSVREAFGLDALVLLKRPSFFVFMASSFLICIPLAFYYQMASKTVAQAELVPAFTMSWGQISEIFFMLVMPLFFAFLGVKWMLAVGMLAWVVRYALFAMGASDEVMWMILGGVLLHGICYDFFFVTGQIYTDKTAPARIRSQAQGMLVLFTLGLGMLIGAQIGGQVEQAYTPPRYNELQAEASAINSRASQETLQLANLLVGQSNPAEMFREVIKADRKITGEEEQPQQLLDRVQGMFMASFDPPLPGYRDKATEAAEPIEERIQQRREEIKKRIDEIDEQLKKETEALRKAETPPLDSRGNSLLNAMIAELQAEKEKQKQAIRKAGNAELEPLQTEKVEAYAQAAASLMREKIQEYNASASEPIPSELEPALLLAAQVESLKKLGEFTSVKALKVIDWKTIWAIPCILAGVILMLFVLFFRDRSVEEAAAHDVAAADAEVKKKLPE